MRILALMNQKGGVGKTTTTVNLGAALAEAGKRVCMIDLDPQSHLTINFGIEPSGEHLSLYDVLVDDQPFLAAVHQVGKNIAVVPSSIDLAGAEIELVSKLGRELILRKKIEAAQHDFDFILIDCPPSLGILTINALAVATEVLIPMQPHFLAMQGMAKLLETIALVKQRMNDNVSVSGIVLTMFDSQVKLTSEVVAELTGFFEQSRGQNVPWNNARVMNTRIRRNIKLAECPGFGQSVLTYDGGSNGAADYRALAKEIIGTESSVVAETIAQAVPQTPVPETPAAATPVPPKIEVTIHATSIERSNDTVSRT